MPKDAQLMEKLVALCKRRGFIFQSSEIYGGINGFWDYGPLGCELKRNIKDAWWHDMVRNPPVGPDGREVSMVGVDCSIIMNPKVWEASGHATGFQDPMVECKECKGRFREDIVVRHLLFEVAEIPSPTAPGIHELIKSVEGKKPAAVVLLLLDTDQNTRNKRFKESLRVKRIEEKLVPRADALSAVHLYFIADERNYVDLGGIADCPPEFLKVQAGEPCPNCGSPVQPPRQFNLMFPTFVGASEDSSARAWLRPETAQGIFVNFKNVCDSTRIKIPFGIAQVGKAFRNEINPRNYTFRSREFEQMEIEFFCHEKDSLKWWEWWRDVRINWYKSLGLAGEKLVPRNQTEKELAHYSKACTDIEYLFPFADEPQELEGVAHRGCFDLTQHQKHSGKDLTYFDDEAWQALLDGRKSQGLPDMSKEEAAALKSKEPYKFLPTVIEPSAGADRATLAFLCDAYTVDPSRPSPEFLKLHPRLAPIKAAVFPLVNKDGLPEIADPIYRDIRRLWPAQYDPKQSIGKRYARMDEAGTPFCFTIDGQTKEDGTVTVRDRDTGGQQRIDKSNVVNFLQERLARK